MPDQRLETTGDTPSSWSLTSQLLDSDPAETMEWLESLDAVVDHASRARAHYLMLSMLQLARERHVGVDAGTTDYINTIPPEMEPAFPGDEDIERRLRAYVRWNAAVLVHRAQRPGIEVGGHISTYASAAALYEVGQRAVLHCHARRPAGSVGVSRRCGQARSARRGHTHGGGLAYARRGSWLIGVSKS